MDRTDRERDRYIEKETDRDRQSDGHGKGCECVRD